MKLSINGSGNTYMYIKQIDISTPEYEWQRPKLAEMRHNHPEK